MTGTITVFNNEDAPIQLATLTDQLSTPTTCTVDTSLNATLIIPASGSYDFPYSCGLSAAVAAGTTNTVTMTWLAQDLTNGDHLSAGTDFDTVPVEFTVSDNCATATDTFTAAGTPAGAADALGTYCADDPLNPDLTGVTLNNFAQSYTAPTWTITYSRTVPAPTTLGTCQEYDNRAEFTDNSTPPTSGHADASATVCAFNAPLTIGYWKTHLARNGTSGCTGLPSGSGCSANGPWTKDGLGKTICVSTSCPNGVVVGNLGNTTITTFQQAAKVFANNNCSNASSSDANAAACLAAQLLGAELNVWNKANPCVCSTIKSAIALLKAVNYDPIANTSHFGGSGYTRANAITLKTALDNYNNGLGCP